MICNKDCFHCRHSDCINDDYGPEELAMVIAFEKLAGVYTPIDAEGFIDELVAACRIEKERARERRSAAVRMSRMRKNPDGFKPRVSFNFLYPKKG